MYNIVIPSIKHIVKLMRYSHIVSVIYVSVIHKLTHYESTMFQSAYMSELSTCYCNGGDCSCIYYLFGANLFIYKTMGLLPKS